MKNKPLFVKIAEKHLGCRPYFREGIFGFAWGCGCRHNDHGADQQCSDLAEHSILSQAQEKYRNLKKKNKPALQLKKDICKLMFD